MRCQIIGLLALAVLSLNLGEGLGQTGAAAPLRTTFFRGPPLTAQEVELVVGLARQCGLGQPEAISDVPVYPNLKSVPRWVVVTGAEQVQGRKAWRSFVEVGSTNWSPAPVKSSAKRLGSFYVNPPFLRTNESSLVNVGTNVIRMRVHKDIPMLLADHIVSRFANREVDFARADLKSNFAWVDVSRPEILSLGAGWGGITNGYRIYFGPRSRQAVEFKCVGDRVVVMHIHEIEVN